jgi:hypothetical protein
MSNNSKKELSPEVVMIFGDSIDIEFFCNNSFAIKIFS